MCIKIILFGGTNLFPWLCQIFYPISRVDYVVYRSLSSNYPVVLPGRLRGLVRFCCHSFEGGLCPSKSWLWAPQCPFVCSEGFPAAIKPDDGCKQSCSMSLLVKLKYGKGEGIICDHQIWEISWWFDPEFSCFFLFSLRSVADADNHFWFLSTV